MGGLLGPTSGRKRGGPPWASVARLPGAPPPRSPCSVPRRRPAQEPGHPRTHPAHRRWPTWPPPCATPATRSAHRRRRRGHRPVDRDRVAHRHAAPHRPVTARRSSTASTRRHRRRHHQHVPARVADDPRDRGPGRRAPPRGADRARRRERHRVLALDHRAAQASTAASSARARPPWSSSRPARRGPLARRTSSGVAGRERRATGDRVRHRAVDRLTKAELDSVPPPRPGTSSPSTSTVAHYPFLGVDRGRSIPVLGTRVAPTSARSAPPRRCGPPGTSCASPRTSSTRSPSTSTVRRRERQLRRPHRRHQPEVDPRGCATPSRARDLDVNWQLPSAPGPRPSTPRSCSGSRTPAAQHHPLPRERLAADARDHRQAGQAGPRPRVGARPPTASACARSSTSSSGTPTRRWSDVWKSTAFLVRAALAGCSDAAVIMFCPYPGSADFRRWSTTAC